MKIFSWIKRLLGGAVIGAEALNTITVVQKVDSVPLQDKKEVKELPWFQRQNNLVQEFVGDYTPVYSSNLEESEPIGYIDGFGNYNSTNGKKEEPKEKEELLQDDVSLLENTAKPTLEEKNTVNYKSGL
jgi:hypothetical protein